MTVPAPSGSGGGGGDDDDSRAVELFGGAVGAVLPRRFVDISAVRPVPDHQEVWGDADSDQSVIIEVAERSAVPDADVGRFVFDDLAAANEAGGSSVDSVRQLAAAELPRLSAADVPYACLVVGRQLGVAKSRYDGDGGGGGPDEPTTTTTDTLEVVLAVLRVPRHDADVLVTVNAPSLVGGGAGARPTARVEAEAVMRAVLRSLEVHDWGLFG